MGELAEQLEKLLSEREASRFLDLTPSALRKWRQLRKGPAFIRLSSRCVKYRVGDLQKFLTERLVTPGRPKATR